MTFWRYVCAALDKIVGGIAEDTEYVRASSEMVKAHIHLNILIDRLAEAPTDFLLVLDDLHEISEPSILKGLSYLMDYLPAKMHLILISRREPELDLARQRIKWQAQRLGEQDLRFQEEEISRFYQARGYSLPEEELKKVESYTEGWAAAMVAVAMSMEHAGGGNALAALPQSSRDIEEYLHDEVISTWRPERLDFALQTCILDTLSPALCEAVTGEIESYRGMISINPGYAPLAIGEYFYESNRPREALPFLLKVVEEGQEADCPGAFVPAMVNIARVKRAEGDISGAFSVLEKCEKMLPDTRKSHWIYLLQACRCRLFMDMGDTEKVLERVLASKLDLFTELSRFKEYELLIYARAMLYLNRNQDTRLLLQRLLTFTAENRRSHSRVEVLNLLALLDYRNHHTLAALKDYG